MNSDSKVQLGELNITATKEIEVGSGLKTIKIFIPISHLMSFQKIQIRLICQLGKKSSGKHAVVVAKTTPKNHIKGKQKHHRSRTLTAACETVLEDVVFTSQILGKRIRVKLAGNQVMKVHLDKSNAEQSETQG